jgi:hypothetical protein
MNAHVGTAFLIGMMAVATVACAPLGAPDASAPSNHPTAGQEDSSAAAPPSDQSVVRSMAPGSDDLTEAEAVAIAREAVPPAFADAEVRNANAGPLHEVVPTPDEFAWSRDLAPERWIWAIFLVTDEPQDENAAMVYLDHADGTVYDVSTGFAD